MAEKEKKESINREGLPMSEESYQEWQKAFTDIEEAINSLYEEDKNAKSNRRGKR